MKKLSLALILLLTLTTFSSCNEESINLSENSKIIISNEEIPIFDNSKSKTQITNDFSKSKTQIKITNDFSRESILDTTNEQLKVPVIFTNENENITVAPAVKFRIATRKSGCKRGIGFRCGNDLPQLKTTDIDLEDEKTFSAKVSYDYKNGYVIYQFNQINWNEL
ncbi:hypothetical protein [Lutibacter sp.]|uniref:hypothetical protein n=1 Tax=Lutibacter sp. TaxID=1925666 RepID=UPI0025C6C23C|nr:hypothetical protein [Lutibacter sp.]MCF6169288.1 hypothetical protein [Lutibacter sp.]